MTRNASITTTGLIKRNSCPADASSLRRQIAKALNNSVTLLDFLVMSRVCFFLPQVVLDISVLLGMRAQWEWLCQRVVCSSTDKLT